MINLISKLNKYSVVQFCTMFLLISSLIFWVQPFVVNSSPILGSELGKEINLTGYEIAFGAVRTFNVFGSEGKFLETIVFNASPQIAGSFYLLICAIIFQIISIFIRKSKKIPYFVWQIIIIISMFMTLFSGILCFMSCHFFDIANATVGTSIIATGANVTGIFIISSTFVILLNMIEKNPKKGVYNRA